MRVDTELATPSSVLGMKGFELHNRALQSEHSGDLVEAERLFLEAIRLKGLHFGLDHWKTATSMNDLGELYLKAGRLDEAEQRLNEANTIRRRLGPEHTFDAAVTREYLAQLSEARGDLDRARTMRQSGGPEKMVCSNSKVRCCLQPFPDC